MRTVFVRASIENGYPSYVPVHGHVQHLTWILFHCECHVFVAC